MKKTERRKMKQTLHMKLGGLLRQRLVQLHSLVRRCQQTVHSLETIWVS